MHVPARCVAVLAVLAVVSAASAAPASPRRIMSPGAGGHVADGLDAAALARADWLVLSAQANERVTREPTVEALARAAVLARLAGDSATLDAHAAALRAAAPATGEVTRAATALVLSDRADDAAAVLLEAGREREAARVLVDELRYAEALDLLAGVAGFDAAADRARLHAALGEPADAARILLDAHASEPSRPVHAVVRELARLGLSAAARRLALQHLDSSGSDRQLLLALHPTRSYEAHAALTWLERTAPDDEPGLRLARLDAVMSPRSRGEDFAAFVAWWLENAGTLADCQAPQLEGAVKLAQRRGDAAAALALAREHARALPSQRAWQELGGVLAARGEWDEAAQANSRAAALAPSDPVGAALASASARRARASDMAGSSLSREAVVGLDGDQRLRLAWALEAQSHGEDVGSDAADLARDLRLGVLADGVPGSAATMAAAQSLARRATCERAWHDAARRWERVRLELVLREPPLAPDQVAESVRLAQAAALESAVAAARWDEALATAAGGLAPLTARLDATADLVRGLAAEGRTDEAEALLARVFDRLDLAAGDFPNSSRLQNSLAWLAARTGHRLDRGLAAAVAADALAPRSPAVLDTLAEARFQSGDRAGAVDAARRAHALDPSRPYLREQLRRMESGDPTSRPPVELE